MAPLPDRLHCYGRIAALADHAPHLAWALVAVLPVVWEPHCYTFVVSAVLIAAWPVAPPRTRREDRADHLG